MLILGIETSCDETAAAVVRDGREILSNVVVSQIDIFAEYGGVIPEVAARSHLEVMMPVIDKALSDASCTWDDIDAIAVTHAPGLLGSLLIGTLTARMLAILHDKPLYAVHHLKSHVYANWLGGKEEPEPENFSSVTRGEKLSETCREAIKFDEDNFSPALLSLYSSKSSDSGSLAPQFPLIALVVSGGHTQILYMPAHNQFEIIGTTHDDAVGECFDKVAKILGLPYPGGPSIASAAEDGDPDRYRLPHPKVPGLDFSFSGLKTAVLRAVQKEVGVPISYPSHKLAELLSEQQVADFAASFQKTAVEILIEKLREAVKLHPEVKSVVLAGGVSANKMLRSEVESKFFSSVTRGEKLSETRNEAIKFNEDNFSPAALRLYSSKNSDSTSTITYFPAPSLSGDNGAMVAAAAYYEIQAGVEPADPYSLNIYPRIEIDHD